MKNYRQGFTLIEVLLCIAIACVLSAAVLWGMSHIIPKRESPESNMATGTITRVQEINDSLVLVVEISGNEYVIDIKNNPDGPQTNHNLFVALKKDDNISFPFSRFVEGKSVPIFSKNRLGIIGSNEIRILPKNVPVETQPQHSM